MPTPDQPPPTAPDLGEHGPDLTSGLETDALTPLSPKSRPGPATAGLPRRPYRYAAMAVALASLLFTACDSETGEQVRSLPACEHFGNVAQDVREGVLTAPELRDKLKEIEEDARAAPDDVKAAATAMLSAMTRGDPAGLVAAGVQMDAACKAHNTSGAS